MAQHALNLQHGRRIPVEPTLHEVISQIDPVTDRAWNRLIDQKPVDLFHSPRWMKVVAESFDVNIKGAVIERHGNPLAGVVWSELDDIFGTRRVTLPYSDYSDIIAADDKDCLALMNVVMSSGVPWTLRSHKTDLADSTDWDTSTRKFAHHVIDVTADEDDLFASLSSMARRNTRKADKAGIEVVEGSTKDDLRAWVDLHIGLRRNKYRMLAQPYSFFENIWDEFIANGDGFLLLAKHNGKIVAGTVYLVSGNTLFYKFNASDMESLKLRPNNALMWQGMLRARERGLEAVDLGRTNDSQEGLKDFKASYGGVPSVMTEYRFTPPGYEPDKAAVDAREVISEVTTLVTDPGVPNSVVEQASSLLYRYFG